MPLKGLLSGSASGGLFSGRTSARGSSSKASLSDDEKLAMLEDLESSGLGWFWSTDPSGTVTYISEAIGERIGIAMDQLLGEPMQAIFAGVDGDERKRSLSLKLGSRKAFNGIQVSPEGGEGRVVIRLSGRPVFGANGKFLGFRGTGSDITEQYYREEETARLAKYDSLTGLSNRHRMAHLIDSTLTAFRQAKRNCAILMLDLDRFKQVNDTLGHAAGDELLKQVAQRLERAVDRECEIGRLGGDEFQVMLPDLDDRGVLGEIAGKIIAMLAQPYSLEEGRCIIGASVGIAVAPHDGVSGKEIVNAADMALYAAKNGGRGQFRFFSADLANEALFRRRLEGDLNEAVSEDQLFLKYQPVLDSVSQQVVSLEATVCWQHPQRGEIDADEFASIMENSSLIVEVGQWAVRRACAEAAGWPAGLRVSVNVPTPLFAADAFTDTVREALEESGLDAGRLELEIKEGVFLGDKNQVDKTLAALFKQGVRLTLDEFGTGYSSLGYLRRAPFDAIKIGNNFYQQSQGEDTPFAAAERDFALVTAIVALAKAMDMATIAAGIDSYDLMESLRDCGVSSLQGDIFTDPLPLAQVEEELAKGDWSIVPTGSRSARAKRRTVLRNIQVIHDDHSYTVTLRNLSKTGALIEGLADVPMDTQFVVDLGAGQLAVATVIRTAGDSQGLEFEQPLVDDGAGGLCTRNRVSPYALAAAGAPLAALGPGDYKGMEGGLLAGEQSVPRFAYAKGYSPEAH